MPRPLPPAASPASSRPTRLSDPWLAGGPLCRALYTPGASRRDLERMRCQWDVLYVRVGSRFDRLGRICIHCGDVRGR